jgi:hypothetical protein
VTIAGQPLSDKAVGGVSFRPMQAGQGREVFAQLTNGRYDSPQTPKGPVKVYFSISQPTGRTIKSERTGQEVPELANAVPEKYAAGVDLDVTGDNSDQNFDLTK